MKALKFFLSLALVAIVYYSCSESSKEQTPITDSTCVDSSMCVDSTE
jgi:hypothetical protein